MRAPCLSSPLLQPFRFPLPSNRTRRVPPALAAFIPLALLTGCHTYTPRPLDPAAHRAEWTARSPSSEPVADFARRIASQREPAPFDPADGLTLPEAEVVALFYNPQLRIARLRAGVALATAQTAGLWQDPTLGVDGERILAGVDHPWLIGATIGLTIPISGTLTAERETASAQHLAALARIAADEWETRARLRRAWLEWSAHTLRAEQTREFLARLDSVVSIAERLEEAGEMPRTEARLFRVERVTRQNDLRLLESRAREAHLAILALMGLTPEAEVALVPQITRSPALPADRLAALEAHSATLAALRADYEVAERALNREVRAQYPDITIGPGLGEEDGDSRVLLGISLPIPLWNRNQRGVAEATAQREVARAEFEAAVEMLGSSLAAAEVQIEALAAQRQELESIVVPLVDQQEADVARLAELGDFNVLLTLETLVRQHETKLRLIEARLEEALAATRIEELLGPPLPISPPTSPDPTSPITHPTAGASL